MKNKLLLLLMICVLGCKDKFDFPLRTTDLSMLVVEGFLNPGGPTTIKLSKTLKVSDKAQFKPELRATVVVEGKDNSKNILRDSGNGTYFLNPLNIQFGKEYRLTIKTSDGRQYASDYVVVKKTPPIDSVSWKKDNGITIYVNTHDPTNNSKYYKWDYEETWEIHSYYDATYKWVGGTTIVPMAPNESTFKCWKYANSTNIFLGSTAQLQSDVVHEFPIIHIDNGSEKMGERYSILIKQRSLMKEAYNYLALMKKNTESLGTIFDPQPSELHGNVHNINNPEELVVGFIDAASMEEKRIFITYFEAGWRYKEDCEIMEINTDAASISKYIPSFYLPFDVVLNNSGSILMYRISTPACVDCRVRGGNLSKPTYW